MKEEKPVKTETPAIAELPLTTPIPPTSEPPTLGMDDIRTILGIINVASKAGAFSAGQLATVGDMYNKLDSFLTWTNAHAVTTNEDTQKPEQGE